jgi:hypothetical protein
MQASPQVRDRNTPHKPSMSTPNDQLVPAKRNHGDVDSQDQDDRAKRRAKCLELLKIARQRQDEAGMMMGYTEVFKAYVPRPDAVSTEKAEEEARDLALLAVNGISALGDTSLVQEQIQKLVTGGHEVHVRTGTSIMKPAKCIDLRGVVFLTAPLSDLTPMTVSRVSANFVPVQAGDKDFFQLNVDDNGTGNAHVTRFSLDSLGQLKNPKKQSSRKKKRQSDAAPDGLFYTHAREAVAQRPMKLCSLQIYVTINPGKDYPMLPAQKLLLLTKVTVGCSLFFVIIPDDLSADKKKELIEKYLNYIDLGDLVSSYFPFGPEDSFTLSTPKLDPYKYFFTVGKGKLADKKYDVKDGIFTKTKWPEICVVTAIMPVGTVEFLGPSSELGDLHKMLGNEEHQSVVKIEGIDAVIDDVAIPSRICMGLLNLKEKDVLSLANMREAILESVFENPEKKLKKVNSLVKTGGLKFQVDCRNATGDVNMPWFVHRNIEQSCTGACLERDIYISVGMELEDQEEKVVAQKGFSSGKLLNMAVALRLRESLDPEVGTQVASLCESLFALVKPTIETNIVDFFIPVADLITGADSSPDIDTLTYSPDQMEALTWSQVLNMLCCNPTHTYPREDISICDVISYFLFCMIVCNDRSTVPEVLDALCVDAAMSSPIFCDDPEGIKTKKFAVQHWFTYLLGSLYWVVDVVYGRERRMPRSWLSLQLQGYSRSTSFSDMITAYISQSHDALYRKSEFPVYSNINPMKMLKFLAVIREWHLRCGQCAFDDVVRNVSTWSAEQAKGHAIDLIDCYVAMKRKFFPVYDDSGDAVAPLAFDETTDCFSMPGIDEELSGPLPVDWDLHGNSVLRALGDDDSD